jgi:hypothetical protein
MRFAAPNICRYIFIGHNWWQNVFSQFQDLKTFLKMPSAAPPREYLSFEPINDRR